MGVPRGDRLTEAGAAERFARLHGDDLRFNHLRGCWLIWQGHRWMQDADAAVTRKALTFARNWQREAVKIADVERRARVFGAAMKLERRDALRGLLALGRDLKPIADAGNDWNSNSWVIGLLNGVLDLRSGRLRRGRREDRITMSAAVPFEAGALCPRWERFLSEIFGGDSDLIGFVHRAIGYSLTGDTSEQCLFILYGTGANGKTTFLSVVGELMGDYAHVMPFSTIELRDRAAIPNDLAALVGRRLVTASETQDGTRLNESRVKALTGCDRMTARFLHHEFFTFQPVAKVWLAVNHKPVVRDDSHGFWRRVRLIPFTQRFAVNPGLTDELRAEARGILAWAVRGCLAWQRDGLRPPIIVAEATREYESDSDPLGVFLSEAVELDPDSEMGASELHEHYRRWAGRYGMSDAERLSATAFGRKMSERFAKRKRGPVSVYRGLRPRSPA